MRFRTFLKNKIKEKKLNNRQLALSIGITPGYIGEIINNKKHPPDKETQEKIAEKLGLEGEDLLDFYDTAAAERKDIPSDIYQEISRQEANWNKIRKFIKELNDE